MSHSISIRQVNHIVVLELWGRLSVQDRTLLHFATSLIERGERYFVISLEHLSYLDNGGLGQLCWIYTAIQNRGGNIKLLKTPDRFKTLLKITGLDTIFQSFESEADAIAAMEPCRPALSA